MRRVMLASAVLYSILFFQRAFADAQDFSFSSFSADYYISRSEKGYASMRVEERLVAQFINPNQNHGIERALPKTYKDMPLNIRVISVTDDNLLDYPFSEYEDENNNHVIRIGDPNVYVLGEVAYRITYSMDNIIFFDTDHEEWYWDINGTGWLPAFDRVDAQVYVPVELTKTLQERQLCFSGQQGSSQQNCSMERFTDRDGSVVIKASTDRLEAGENLSMVIAWEKDTFTLNPWPSRISQLYVLLGFTIPALTAGLMFREWWRFGKDPEGRGVIIPQYDPPLDLNLLEADTVLHERFRTPAISAEIIRLAINGNLRIHERKSEGIIKTKSDYELELVDMPADDDQIRKIIEGLFSSATHSGSVVALSEKAHELSAVTSTLANDVPVNLTTRGYFRINPKKAMTKYIVFSIILFVLGFVFANIIAPVGVGIIISGVIMGLFVKSMPVRTPLGVSAREHLLGLKSYIQLSESDRLNYLQSPQSVSRFGKPTAKGTLVRLYETLLPYAMLFNLEKQWSKQFEKLYAKPPDWYNGPSGQSFTPAVFAQSLGDFESQTKNVFTAQSESSGGGFSGGGSSGGGGGGGGGGGW